MPFISFHIMCPICDKCINCGADFEQITPEEIICPRTKETEKHTHEVRAANDVRKWKWVFGSSE